MKGRICKSCIVSLLFVGIVMLSSCTRNQAEETFKTAQFEELQNNREHAQQLYESIVKRFPESEYAKKAEERLSELGK